jgi:hypothetical protein
MNYVKTSFYPEQFRELDELAKSAGIKNTRFIRECVMYCLRHDQALNEVLDNCGEKNYRMVNRRRKQQ